ncbi:uncharacterized protein [Primulina eburnea]|uniref:uncharacterized protein isoform X1 n=2 Tax=Primulina eburnea TaxID=1245227 RepID=UPI003C6C3EDC
MVQLMGSPHVDGVEDFSEEEYGPLSKRSCSSASQSSQWSSRNHEFPISPSEYNPLDEPGPLGLRLRKSPSLADLIQMRLSQGTTASTMLEPGGNAHSLAKTDVKGGVAASCANDKLKASNFPALLLRIGAWEYVSRYEGDLVAKCYFAKHKLVWEVLEGGLKSKIEIQWSDITALKAECPDNGPSTLTIVLARQPIFYRETNPQPRKHTLWQASADFTDGQAEKNRQHYLQCPPGVLNKHYEKLIQCDVRLCILSRQPEIVMDSPYFDSQVSGLENSEECKSEVCNDRPAVAEGSPSVFQDVAPAAAVPLASFAFVQNPLVAQHVSKEAPSPISVMDTRVNEGDIKFGDRDSVVPKIWEPPRVHGLPHSMSVSDLVNHIGNCISEQVTCGNLPSNKASECQDMLENISQILLSDTQHAIGLDEKSLMKKVNSLCCLLQDPVAASNAQVRESHHEDIDHGKDISSEVMNNSVLEDAKCKLAFEGNFKNGVDINQKPSISRKDSLNDFFLHLPHIASLPKFLFGISEDDEFQAT